MTDEMKEDDYIKLPKQYSMESWRERLLNVVNNVNYYVYEHYLDGDLFYIGKGTGDRCLIFKDRSISWHELAGEREDEIIVYIIRVFKFEEDALNYELEAITSNPEEVRLVNKTHYKKQIKAPTVISKPQSKHVVKKSLRNGLRRSSISDQRNKLLFYGNMLNTVSLSKLTKVQADVFMALLSNARDCNRKEEKVTISISLKEIREYTDNSSIKSSTISRTVKELECIKVISINSNEHYYLISSSTITSKGSFEVVFSSFVSEGSRYRESEHTSLNLSEYSNLKSRFSKELYRTLRQFRTLGELIIEKENIVKLLQPPKSYNEYDFIRKTLLKAVEDNNKYFSNLKIGNLTGNYLPEVLKFEFDKHKKESIDIMLEKLND